MWNDRVCQKREPVSDNTVVFHIQLLLPDGQKLGQTLCSQGFATRDVPLPPPLSVHCDTADVSDSSVAAANVSFGILAPVNPVPPESLVRLSSKRFVRYCHLPLLREKYQDGEAWIGWTFCMFLCLYGCSCSIGKMVWAIGPLRFQAGC